MRVRRSIRTPMDVAYHLFFVKPISRNFSWNWFHEKNEICFWLNGYFLSSSTKIPCNNTETHIWRLPVMQPLRINLDLPHVQVFSWDNHFSLRFSILYFYKERFQFQDGSWFYDIFYHIDMLGKFFYYFCVYFTTVNWILKY